MKPADLRLFLHIAAVVLALAVVACHTRAIVEREPIPVPAGLTADKVEDVIRLALSSDRDRITTHGNSRFWAYGTWQVEEHQPGHLKAGFHLDKYYLQMAIDYSQSEVRTHIAGSRNLDQDGQSINRQAIIWQENLEHRIAQELQWAAKGSH